MLIKLLSLNILYGKYLDNIIKYVKKENFDILCFQEVSGGELSFHKNNCYTDITNKLGYKGEKIVSWHVAQDKESYEANVIFYKPSFQMIRKKGIWLSPFYEVPRIKPRKFEDDPRTVLRLALYKDGKEITIVTTHLAWSPDADDAPHKLEQGRRFFEYLQGIERPFILTGDFNLGPHTQVAKWINLLGRNLIVEHNITNTLNLRNHKAKDELSPEGLAVDYIYVTEGVHVKKFKVLNDLDLSDHLGLYLECEI